MVTLTLSPALLEPLAVLIVGKNGIPLRWLVKIEKSDYLADLAERLAEAVRK